MNCPKPKPKPILEQPSDPGIRLIALTRGKGALMLCPHCHQHISETSLLSAAAKVIRGRGGYSAPKKLSPCKWCASPFGVAELRKHKPACPKNPRNI